MMDRSDHASEQGGIAKGFAMARKQAADVVCQYLAVPGGPPVIYEGLDLVLKAIEALPDPPYVPYDSEEDP